MAKKKIVPVILSATEVVEVVDEMGMLRAELAPLEEKYEALKAKLVADGGEEFDGEFFRVTVSRYGRDCLDMDAVRAKLSPQFIRANTRTTPVVKVNAPVARVPAAAKLAYLKKVAA